MKQHVLTLKPGGRTFCLLLVAYQFLLLVTFYCSFLFGSCSLVLFFIDRQFLLVSRYFLLLASCFLLAALYFWLVVFYFLQAVCYVSLATCSLFCQIFQFRKLLIWFSVVQCMIQTKGTYARHKRKTIFVVTVLCVEIVSFKLQIHF